MNPLSPYAGATLSSLANLLSAGYYGMLDALLHELAPPRHAAAEDEAWAGPLGELRGMVRWRVETLIPYLHALAGKQDTGHNCTLCTGSCDMQHRLRLMELEDGHKQFSVALSSVMDVQPLYRLADPDTPLPAVRSLRIIATAIEMIHTERTYLVPLIHQARKDIYADASGPQTSSRAAA